MISGSMRRGAMKQAMQGGRPSLHTIGHIRGGVRGRLHHIGFHAQHSHLGGGFGSGLGGVEDVGGGEVEVGRREAGERAEEVPLHE